MKQFFQRLIEWWANINKQQLPNKPVGVGEETVSIGLPTREEMAKVIINLINGITQSPSGPYRALRETDGNNRSKMLDAMIKRQGGNLGDAWCMFFQQQMLDDLCAIYGVSRKLVKIPEGGSTQSVIEATTSKYRLSAPKVCTQVIWRRGTTWTGHVGMVLKLVSSTKFETFEGNTSADQIGGEIIRDGQGAYFKQRTTSGYGQMQVRGYIDVYQAICDAIESKGQA